METRTITNQTLKEYLKASLESDNDSLGRGWNYLKDNIPMNLHQIVQTDEYKSIASLDQRVDLILTKINGDTLEIEERKQLKSFTYIQDKLEREERERVYNAKMIAEGWEHLTPEMVKQAKAQGKKIKVMAQATHDWLSVGIDKTYKPFVNGEQIALMDLRARTRGYHLRQFENAFCKLI